MSRHLGRVDRGEANAKRAAAERVPVRDAGVIANEVRIAGSAGRDERAWLRVAERLWGARRRRGALRDHLRGCGGCARGRFREREGERPNKRNGHGGHDRGVSCAEPVCDDASRPEATRWTMRLRARDSPAFAHQRLRQNINRWISSDLSSALLPSAGMAVGVRCGDASNDLRMRSRLASRGSSGFITALQLGGQLRSSICATGFQCGDALDRREGRCRRPCDQRGQSSVRRIGEGW